MLAQVPHIRFMMDFPSRVLLRVETNFEDQALLEWYHTLVAGSVIFRRVTIRSKPSSLMANYIKIKRVELAQSHCYQRTVIALSDHPRWMFRKNSMEFFIVLSYYLYYFTVAVLLKVHDHMSFQNVWPCHMIWLAKSPCYLYLDPIVHLEVVDQMFKCVRNYFFFGALITVTS